jgi:hypothetical protein
VEPGYESVAARATLNDSALAGSPVPRVPSPVGFAHARQVAHDAYEKDHVRAWLRSSYPTVADEFDLKRQLRLHNREAENSCGVIVAIGRSPFPHIDYVVMADRSHPDRRQHHLEAMKIRSTESAQLKVEQEVKIWRGVPYLQNAQNKALARIIPDGREMEQEKSLSR